MPPAPPAALPAQRRRWTSPPHVEPTPYGSPTHAEATRYGRSGVRSLDPNATAAPRDERCTLTEAWGDEEPESSEEISPKSSNRTFWRLTLATGPAASSLIFSVVVLLSFVFPPSDEAEWSVVEEGSYNPVEHTYALSRRSRVAYRIYLCLIWPTATVFELLLLSRCQQLPRIERRLPITGRIFNGYRLALAIAELVVLFDHAQSPWDNPGLGMFGWGASFGADFPLVKSLDDLTHVGLALAAPVCIYILAMRPEVSVEQGVKCVAVRFAAACLLGVAYWYPIYDAKHWYGGSHLGNLGGEYLPLYALLSSLLEWRLHAAPPRPDPTAWRFGRWAEAHQATMLSLAVLKTVSDLCRCGQSWGMLSTYPVLMHGWPPECSIVLGDFNLSDHWKNLVVFGANLGGLVLLFVLSEVALYLDPSGHTPEKAEAGPEPAAGDDAERICD